MDDWIGTTLEGRYEVQQELGAGGMGSVYLARDVRLDRRVVVKIPHRDLLQDEQFRTRFLSEVRGMSRLEHAHVIKIHDAGEHDSVPFAVVQFVGGGDLRARVPRGEKQSAEEALQWARPVAAALDFIHQKNFVHRDVKPGNILFDSNGFPYLSDFGIATVMRTAEDTQDGQLTQVGTFVGSPVYSPPEALARELSPQYDQYSLAVVLYEVLSGAFPYDARSATQVMGAKIRDDPRPLLEIAPEVPPAVADVVMKGLARDPAARFGTCVELVEAFEVALRSTPAPSSRRRPRRGALRGRSRGGG
ncbi:MAG: serine/threonine-protein kinase, partial [Myxococcota bacterium]|nr:serine/threonine-protein kinase [Myxococcota bacterium]